MNNFTIIDLIKCKIYYDMMSLPSLRGRKSNDGNIDCNNNNHKKYFIVYADPATGVLYITENSPSFISGHLRMRGKNGGRYPYSYLEMIDNIFGREENTIEVCSGSIKGIETIVTTSGEGNSATQSCFTVDINPNTKPDLIADGQKLDGIPYGKFNRWRCDPPYNARTAKEMYGTDLPNPIKLLKAGARVCKPHSLMFLLLGPQNIQICPEGLKRIGYVNITVVPNNEMRVLNIY
jgi:hypothetical protein